MNRLSSALLCKKREHQKKYWEVELLLGNRALGVITESMLTIIILTFSFFCHPLSHILSCGSFPVSSALPLAILLLIYSIKLQLFLLNHILFPWLSFFGSSHLLPQYLPLGDLLWYEKLLNSYSMKNSPFVLHVKPNSFSEHFYYFDPLIDDSNSHPEHLVYNTFLIKLQTH